MLNRINGVFDNVMTWVLLGGILVCAFHLGGWVALTAVLVVVFFLACASVNQAIVREKRR